MKKKIFQLGLLASLGLTSCQSLFGLDNEPSSKNPHRELAGTYGQNFTVGQSNFSWAVRIQTGNEEFGGSIVRSETGELIVLTVGEPLEDLINNTEATPMVTFVDGKSLPLGPIYRKYNCYDGKPNIAFARIAPEYQGEALDICTSEQAIQKNDVIKATGHGTFYSPDGNASKSELTCDGPSEGQQFTAHLYAKHIAPHGYVVTVRDPDVHGSDVEVPDEISDSYYYACKDDWGSPVYPLTETGEALCVGAVQVSLWEKNGKNYDISGLTINPENPNEEWELIWSPSNETTTTTTGEITSDYSTIESTENPFQTSSEGVVPGEFTTEETPHPTTQPQTSSDAFTFPKLTSSEVSTSYGFTSVVVPFTTASVLTTVQNTTASSETSIYSSANYVSTAGLTTAFSSTAEQTTIAGLTSHGYLTTIGQSSTVASTVATSSEQTSQAPSTFSQTFSTSPSTDESTDFTSPFTSATTPTLFDYSNANNPSFWAMLFTQIANWWKNKASN